MATRRDMNLTYNYMDEFIRISLGENPDITCAFYNGDYSKTLAQAQQDKHDYILDSVLFTRGSRLLDIGCGWGPILSAARKRDGSGIGLTLSDRQAAACRRNGFEVYVLDWKEVDPTRFDRFNAVVSVGAFEHFCSVEEYQHGEQTRIYTDFFKLAYSLLRSGERLFVQTCIWGKYAIPFDRFSLHAPADSNEYMLAVLAKFYPGTWLPLSEDQILQAADSRFRAIDIINGRRDYVQTTRQWGEIVKVTPRKIISAFKLLPYFWRDSDFKYRLETAWKGYMGTCLDREVIDHRRLVFERI